MSIACHDVHVIVPKLPQAKSCKCHDERVSQRLRAIKVAALHLMLQNPGWLPEGGLLGYHCTSKYANIGEAGKYIVETCLKGNDVAFWSAAKILGLQPEVLPIWENPHFGPRNYDDEDYYDEDTQKSQWAEKKRDHRFIISDKWNWSFEADWDHEGYDTPRNLCLPGKEGYDMDKITWCNSQPSSVTSLGHLGLHFELAIPDSHMGNEPARKDMQFYNMAGIFCKISPAFERCATVHVPVISKRSREQPSSPCI